MSNETFQIKFQKMYDRRVYTATVEIIYRTDNVIRFNIRAGEKEVYMEKWLFRKSNQWKITGTNFKWGNDTKSQAMLILSIQKEIDFKLKEIP